MKVTAIVLWTFCLVVVPAILELSFRQTSYFKQKRRGFFSTLFDKGAYGEYLIYKNLRQYEQQGAKFLFNVYLPSQNRNVDTTEVDVVMITTKGIYVFESKNYSGWIFGNDRQKMWTQCLPQGQGRKALKEKFYNPIWQNNAHIKALKSIFSNNSIPTYSIIAFSDRCTFKDITLPDSSYVWIIKRGEVRKTVRNIEDSIPVLYDNATVNAIYNTLFPYCDVSEDVKQQHIEQIQNMR